MGEPLLASRGVSSAVVIAKHLCGVGTDLALKLVNRWRTGHIEGEPAAAVSIDAEVVAIQPDSCHGPAGCCDELVAPLRSARTASQTPPASQVESARVAVRDSGNAGSRRH